MNTTINGVSIAAIAASLPREVVAVDSFAARYGRHEVERIARSTGIEAIRVAGGLTTGDLSTAAAHSLCAAIDADPASIDGLVLVTQTPDCAMPATSALIAHRLGLRRDVVAFDLNFGCSGYIYGLYQAALLVAAGGCRRVLVCTGDVITKLLHPDDRHVRLVFGDAATATLIEQGNDAIDFAFSTDGSGMQHLHTPLAYTDDAAHASRTGHLFMDGAQVMSFALEQVPLAVNAFLATHRLTLDEVPLFLFHQANRFMLHYLARKLGIAPQRMPVSVGAVGNTGPSSIPLTVSLAAAETGWRHQGVLACGFGVGLSVGVARLSLRNTVVAAPVDVGDETAGLADAPGPAPAPADDLLRQSTRKSSIGESNDHQYDLV
ncbi:ketoacyl-ACP synthase III [Paraburkholderia lacunae]|nr:ketoacyl-ACP synthase III [Paraburkholderia lacunae]